VASRLLLQRIGIVRVRRMGALVPSASTTARKIRSAPPMLTRLKAAAIGRRRTTKSAAPARPMSPRTAISAATMVERSMAKIGMKWRSHQPCPAASAARVKAMPRPANTASIRRRRLMPLCGGRRS
jgi:hypothetical protein